MDWLQTVDHFTEFFPSLKEWDTFGWDLYGVTGFGITSLTRITVAYAETSETTQLYFISLAQGLGNTVQQDIDHSLSLLFSKLNFVSDLLNELCLCHAFRSPGR